MFLVARRNRWKRTIDIFLLQWESEKSVSPVLVPLAASAARERRGRTVAASWAEQEGTRGGGPDI